ncbi:HEAT repeat domain-containing protein [Candidatus Nitronereus thalassa]|uniref:HEAT repeat domain-containing protein n=1 Tax=Candidatus Nitronereus thalassa TaxID=3020898 RepID=A0ABU3KAT1_9BACT|nr:HEAT repeat domain-containing protein [Candidatus Nitronereus thalassa]MDT7043457.1 HEAT repeat domain-containing protein [Candidatus Nitronereus thalassa]
MRIVLPYLLLVFTLLSAVNPPEPFARRNAHTPEQIERLKTAQTIHIHTLALTEKGRANSETIHRAISDRVKSFGLTVVDSPTQPHDAVLKVKCEERRSIVAMTKIGGDADQPGSPSRHWKGPACQFSYSIEGQVGPWRQEVRTTFEDSWEAAQTNGHKDSGLYALEQLTDVLKDDDFALELLSEWKQADRLASLLTSPDSSLATKHTILKLAKKAPGPPMLQALQTTMAQKDLAPDATQAMGFMGTAATPILLDLLQHSDSDEIKALAAHALGEIGTRSGDMTILPPLLAMVDSPTIDLQVQTEIVKTLGKIPDQRSVGPLKTLGVKTWTSRSNDPRMQELREAIDMSLWQISPNPHSE